MFHVGQLVVCVDDAASHLVFFDADAPSGGLLEKGRIYTVREAGPPRMFVHPKTREFVSDTPVWLEEVVRSQGEWRDEPFGSVRFRPVDERKIEVFTKMLAPVKEDA